MTANTRTHFYFPAWQWLARTRGWTMKGGRLLADVQEQRAEFRQCAEFAQVIDYAETLPIPRTAP